MQQIGLFYLDHLPNAPGKATHDPPLCLKRKSLPDPRLRPVISNPVDRFLLVRIALSGHTMFRGRECHRQPASFALGLEDAIAAIGVSAVHRKAVVQDMENL